MNSFSPLVMLIGRILISVIFIMSGIDKISNLEMNQGYMASMGVAPVLIFPAIAVELLGGIAVVVGFYTRIAAFLLAGFTLLSGLLFHFIPSDPMQMISFMKNVAITGGFLFLIAHGAGAWSVDAKRKK